MKKLGCLVSLFGMLLGSMSVFLFGAAVWRLVHGAVGIAYAVPTTAASEELEFSVTPGVTHRLAYRAEVASAEGRFRIAIAWRVRSRDGAVISEGTRDASDSSAMPAGRAEADGPVLVEQPLGSIPPSAEGALKVWVGATPDAALGERIQHAWLVVSDEESDPGRLALGGAALLAVGPMLVTIGFWMLLHGFFGRARGKPATKTKADADPETGAAAGDEETPPSEPPTEG